MEFVRITAVPKIPDDRPDLIRVRRLEIEAALASAHGRQSLVASAWVREGGDPNDARRAGPLTVILGGSNGFPTTHDRPSFKGRRAVLFPPGADGAVLPAIDAVGILEGFEWWTRCLGKPDALTRHAWMQTDRADPRASASFEHQLAHLGRRPFAWLVIAEPVPRERLDDQRREISVAMAGLEDRAQQAGLNRMQLERAEERLREYLRSGMSGFWQTHVLVGTTTAEDLAVVAPILCAGTELQDLPYLLRPAPSSGQSGLATVLESPLQLEPEPGVDPPWACLGSPFLAGPDLLSALIRPPERELYGVRMALPHRFDITPERDGALGDPVGAGPRGARGRAPAGDEPLGLGDVLDESLAPAGPFPITRATLNRHTFVCGATGAGKSQTVRSLLEGLSRATPPVSWTVIEPAKAEYGRMAGRLAGHSDVFVVRTGDVSTVPACLNPLEPEPGYPIQSHIDLVRAVFLAAFEAVEPFPQVLSLALTRTYEELGWDLVLSRPRQKYKRKFLVDDPDEPQALRYPTLGDLQRTAQDVVTAIGYGPIVAADIRGFIDVRVGSLRLGSPGRFFEGGFPIDVGRLLDHNVVLEIENIANDQDKAFLIGIVLVRLVEHLRVRYRGVEEGVPLRHVTVIEEAHRLLKNVADHNPARHAVELFASLLAEVRAYGEGIIVAEQIPSKIVPDVVKNSALKVMHRTPAQDDRDLVGATMNVREEHSQYVVSLEPGMAAVATDGMDWPVLVQMPGSGEGRESSKAARTDLPFVLPRSEDCPASCLAQQCTLAELREAELIAADARFTLWVELVAVAHVVGVAVPVVSESVAAWLRSQADVDRIDCATALSAERAVAAREAALSAFVDPGDFRRHLIAALRAQLADEDDVCTDDGPRWQAGTWRWVDVRASLEEAATSPKAAGRRHEWSDRWERRGLILPGAKIAEQLTSLGRDVTYLPSKAHRVAVGALKVSGLAAALDTFVGRSTAPEDLEAAFRQVTTGEKLPHLAIVLSKQIPEAIDGK